MFLPRLAKGLNIAALSPRASSVPRQPQGLGAACGHGMALVGGAGMRYDAAAGSAVFQPMSAGFSPHRLLAVPSPGSAPEVPVARARPLLPPDSFDRVVGEAPALQTMRAQRRQPLTAFRSLGEAGSQPLFRALMAEMHERVGQVTAALACWTWHWRWPRYKGPVTPRRSCIGSRESCCSRALRRIMPRPKPVFARLSTSPAASSQILGAAGSHAPEPALAGSG